MSSLLPTDFRALLSGPRRRFYIATLLGAVGSGLILSLNVVYVHQVRHESILFAEALLVANAILGLALSPLIGTLTDKIGPTKLMIVGLFIEASGLILFAVATTQVELIVSFTTVVIGSSGVWGPSSVLLTRLFEPEHRQRAYGLNFMLLNLGIGCGTLISASVVNLRNPLTFTWLYRSTGLLTLATALVIVTLSRYGNPVAHEHDDEKGDLGGWREVLADRRLRHFMAAAILLMICGYGSIESGFSLFIVSVAHLPTHYIGLAFAFNTITIVIAQLFTLRYIEGRRRTRVMGLVGILWGSSWLLVASSLLVGRVMGLVVLCASTTIFAVGETFWSPVAPALVNEMAPEHLRGRYNSAFGLTWSVAGTIAPLITALFIGTNLGWCWPLFVAGGAAGGGLVALTLRRSLSDVEDGLVPSTIS